MVRSEKTISMHTSDVIYLGPVHTLARKSFTSLTCSLTVRFAWQIRAALRWHLWKDWLILFWLLMKGTGCTLCKWPFCKHITSILVNTDRKRWAYSKYCPNVEKRCQTRWVRTTHCLLMLYAFPKVDLSLSTLCDLHRRCCVWRLTHPWYYHNRPNAWGKHSAWLSMKLVFFVSGMERQATVIKCCRCKILASQGVVMLLDRFKWYTSEHRLHLRSV